MTGIKSTIAATPPSAIHVATGFANGINAAALIVQLQQAVSDVIYLCKQIIAGMPGGTLLAASNPSTSSPNITMSQKIPPWVTAGMNVFDTTANKQIGVVSSGAGTLTLVLQANAANAGSGSNDFLQLTDANAATYSGLITALS